MIRSKALWLALAAATLAGCNKGNPNDNIPQTGKADPNMAMPGPAGAPGSSGQSNYPGSGSSVTPKADKDAADKEEAAEPADKDAKPADKDAKPADKEGEPAEKDAKPAEKDAKDKDKEMDKGAAAGNALSAAEVANINKLPDPKDRAAALAQQVCPISGGHLGDEDMGTPIKVTADGKTAFLCCGGCKKDFAKDPAGALAKLAAKK